jgi:UDP-2,3-diacylglucosamine hydrolase
MGGEPPCCGRAVFFSDVHLDPKEPARTAMWLGFMDAVRAARFERAYIVGDLFQYWVGAGHERLPDFRAPIERLRALAGTGCRISLVHGNRDFHLGPALARSLGAEIVPDSTRVRVGGRMVYVAHGDLLLARDTRYRAMRRVIRSGAVRRAYLALPIGLRLRVAGGMRGVSEREVAAKSARTLALSPSAVRRLFRGDVEAAVIGHVHSARRIALEAGGRRRLLLSLGAWEEGAASYLVMDERGYWLYDGPAGERVLDGTWEEALGRAPQARSPEPRA